MSGFVSPRPAARRRRGFTLLEILLALALMASLLVSLNVFVFSMAEIWGKGRDERLFLQHARAVTVHVEGLLRSGAAGPGGAGLEIKEVKQEAGGEQTELAFTRPEGSRLLVWPQAPLPDVDMSLAVDTREGRGLVLHWQSRLEEDYADDAPRTAVVSPFVKSMGWDYYNESFRRWETLEEPKRESDGTYVVPGRLRLRFAHGAFSTERVIKVPAKVEGATNY